MAHKDHREAIRRRNNWNTGPSRAKCEECNFKAEPVIQERKDALLEQSITDAEGTSVEEPKETEP